MAVQCRHRDILFGEADHEITDLVIPNGVHSSVGTGEVVYGDSGAECILEYTCVSAKP